MLIEVYERNLENGQKASRQGEHKKISTRLKILHERWKVFMNFIRWKVLKIRTNYRPIHLTLARGI